MCLSLWDEGVEGRTDPSVTMQLKLRPCIAHPGYSRKSTPMPRTRLQRESIERIQKEKRIQDALEDVGSGKLKDTADSTCPACRRHRERSVTGARAPNYIRRDFMPLTGIFLAAPVPLQKNHCHAMRCIYGKGLQITNF